MGQSLFMLGVSVLAAGCHMVGAAFTKSHVINGVDVTRTARVTHCVVAALFSGSAILYAADLGFNG